MAWVTIAQGQQETGPSRPKRILSVFHVARYGLTFLCGQPTNLEYGRRPETRDPLAFPHLTQTTYLIDTPFFTAWGTFSCIIVIT